MYIGLPVLGVAAHYDYVCSLIPYICIHIQSVSERDDLFPMEGSEDWTTEIQHPKSPSLRDQVPLMLTQNRAFEYLIPSHTAQELQLLSQNMCRMEFHNSFEFKFLDDRSIDKIADYQRRFSQQQLLDGQHTHSKL